MENGEGLKPIELILARLDNGVPEGTGYTQTTHERLAEIKTMHNQAEGGHSKEADRLATENLANAAWIRMTTLDHATLGSGVPESHKKLGDEHPVVDSMTDEQIRDHLDQGKKALERVTSRDWLARIENFNVVRGLRLDIEYLKSIGRLPEEYTDFNALDYLKGVLKKNKVM